MIRSTRPAQEAAAYPASRLRKTPAPYTSGYRGVPDENLGLLARIDAAKDSVSDADYQEMLSRAAKA